MSFFKSKGFIILLCVAIVLTVVPTVLAAMGKTGVLRNIVMTVTYPVRWIFNTAARGVGNFFGRFSDFDRISEENAQLREQLAEAQKRLENADIAIDENEWLRSFFGVTGDDTTLKLVDASVVGYESGNAETVYTLDKGSMHGVRKNLAVITSDGLVGCVTEVGLNWCRVTCLIEDPSAVGCFVPRTGDHGIVRGDYSQRASGRCLMTELPEDADIEEGDVVRTNGIGSVYPRGVNVGYIESVTLDRATRTKTAVVRPSVDFDSLRRVMIVLSYETVETEPETDTGTETEAETESETESAAVPQP